MPGPAHINGTGYLMKMTFLRDTQRITGYVYSTG